MDADLVDVVETNDDPGEEATDGIPDDDDLDDDDDDEYNEEEEGIEVDSVPEKIIEDQISDPGVEIIDDEDLED